MSNHVISTHDNYEVTFYLLHGCNVDTIHALPVHDGSYKCMCTVAGDEKLQQLQQAYYNNPSVNLTDFRHTLHRVNSLIGKARKDAYQKSKQGGRQ